MENILDQFGADASFYKIDNLYKGYPAGLGEKD